MIHDVIVFDTEFTAWQGSMARNWKGPGEHREIVQIGAIRLGAQQLDEKSSFNILIKPVRNPVLSSYFEALTHITNARLQEEGTSFSDGIAAFQSFIGQSPTFAYGRDDLIIAENAMLLGQRALWQAAPATNLRRWLEEVGVPLAGIHSGELAAHVGAAAQGRIHDALTDARSLAEAIRYLVARGAPNPFRQLAPYSDSAPLS